MFISVEELISGRDAWSMPSVRLAPVDLTYTRFFAWFRNRTEQVA